MADCLVCGEGRIEPVLDFGAQPVSTHFRRPGRAPSSDFPLTLGFCCRCGLVQLEQPFPAHALTPQFDWVSYREPEGHLDDLVETILRLDGVSGRSVIAGISVKDRTVLDRLGRLGCADRWMLDVHADLGASDRNANIEMVQDLLTPETATSIVHEHGLADVVIVRHVLEHTARPMLFLQALAHMVRDDGYLVLEVPDCAKNLARADYTMVWEEHSLYLTVESFRRMVCTNGFAEVHFAVYPYAFEDVMVLIVRKQHRRSDETIQKPAAVSVDETRRQLVAFAEAFPRWTSQYRATISRSAADAPAALYGAGHLAAAFVNYHGLQDLFAFVVDDTAAKQGLCLPNSGLEIVPRQRLIDDGIRLCLFALSPESEDKVIASNGAFLEAGGRFHSVLVDSPRSIRNLVSDRDLVS